MRPWLLVMLGWGCAEPYPSRPLPSLSIPPQDTVTIGGDADTAAADTGTPDTGPRADTGGDTGAVETPEEDVEAADCDLTHYEAAVQYAEDHPLRDGGSWSGWCASLMWRFVEMPESSARASAILAYADSQIAGLDPRDAPAGAFHWWDIGAYGHVGLDLLGGGGTVFMASSYVLEAWGTAIGVTSVPRYTDTTGATYLGWSMDYAESTLDGGGAAACDAHQVYAGAGTVPITLTASSGEPNTVYWMRMQLWASQHGYTGPVDGELGVNSWRGVQRALQALGYTEVDDIGTPDTNTYQALQSLAVGYGYTGPIDGVFGPNSYRGVARFLNAHL